MMISDDPKQTFSLEHQNVKKGFKESFSKAKKVFTF